MSSPVIQVENLSKLYRLGEVGTGTLQHDINRWWHRIRGKEDPYAKIGRANDRTQKKDESIQTDYVWALKDVSFEVRQGEVLGIIGRNGAGKSTLLKLLSRVTSPTTGNIKVKGRIASLLEVGTGFHPELSGRENIYLNGAILGMRRHEITRRLDEIVEFSGCAAYLDTPVKRYSSGMYVRLAFAVAAHLEPEILVVDEVLAVGDAEFQKKCLGKLRDVSYGGRTVLFVSHNLPTLQKLCPSTMLMAEGRVVSIDSTSKILAQYLATENKDHFGFLADRTDRTGNGHARFIRIWIEDIEGCALSCASSGQGVQICLCYKSDTEKIIKQVKCSIAICDQENNPMILLSSELPSVEYHDWQPSGVVKCQLAKLPLSQGTYRLMVYLECQGAIVDFLECASELKVENGDFYGSGRVVPSGWEGRTVLVNQVWKMPLEQ